MTDLQLIGLVFVVLTVAVFVGGMYYIKSRKD